MKRVVSSAGPRKEGHIILLGNGPWADTKQLCIFATRLIRARRVNVTIFTNAGDLERAKREISSELGNDGARAAFIRIIVLLSDKYKHFVDPDFDAAVAKAYVRILSGAPINCAATKRWYGPLPAPQAIVTPKNSTLEALRRVRAERGTDVKLYTWYSRVPSTLFFFHGPAERGGVGELRKKIAVESERRHAPPEEVLEETVLYLESVLIRIPGYEPIYNHECQPQELPHHGTLGIEWLTIYDMLSTSDGVLMPTPECFDALSIIGVRYWMGESGRRAYAVGPTVSTGAHALENELMEADKGPEIRDFVSRVLKSHGPQSMIYISLGTWMWPKYPDKMWTFLDAVMDLGIPFIMSYASELAVIPDEVREKVERYQLGLLSSWCPQQLILNHPVTAWFLTHCGHNSVMESISAGVPMICWPFVGDGALNAIHLTDTLQCAYELLEVRTGHGLGRIYRTGAIPAGTPAAIRDEAARVLRAAFGEDGARRRANVRKARACFEQAWAPGGESTRAVETFLEDHGL